ncbi:MAG: DUF1697 domain-containing protein [Acidobacteriaceae bacterium]
MTTYIALLRAVNLGPTNRLPMAVLKATCEQLGFNGVRTYLASGNVVFESKDNEAFVKRALEAALLEYAGKPVGVVVRTGAEMAEVLKGNPFPGMPGNKTVAIFLDDAPAENVMDSVTNRMREELRVGRREIYVYYADGIGEAKLKIPGAKQGTARNMNTIAKLAEMACGTGPGGG